MREALHRASAVFLSFVLYRVVDAVACGGDGGDAYRSQVVVRRPSAVCDDTWGKLDMLHTYFSAAAVSLLGDALAAR